MLVDSSNSQCWFRSQVEVQHCDNADKWDIYVVRDDADDGAAEEDGRHEGVRRQVGAE